MIKISELKEGDVLKNLSQTITILHNLGKVVITENMNGVLEMWTEKRLYIQCYELVLPAPEKKYFKEFEVRKYPERPIVEVCDHPMETHKLRRLIEITNTFAICENETDKTPTRWACIYKIPETKIVE